VGDVIGLGVDIDNCIIYIYINDQLVFQSSPYSAVYLERGVYPTITLARGEHCQLRFGTHDTPLKYKIPPGFQSWPIPEKFLSSINDTKLFGPVPIIPMNDGSNSYSTNQAGMLMVHMMGRSIDYAAKKNALVGA